MLPLGGVAVPPLPPPAPAQLVAQISPADRIAARSTDLRRRRAINGKKNEQVIGSHRKYSGEREGARTALATVFPVEIFTVRDPVAFAGTDSEAGLKLQEEFAGSELQEKVNVPLDPLEGVSVSI